jgi:hypothetical protein
MTDAVRVACIVNRSGRHGALSLVTPGVVDVSNITGPVTLQFDLYGLPGWNFLATSPFGIVIANMPNVTYEDVHEAHVEFDSYTRVSDTTVTVNDKNDNTRALQEYSFCVTVTDGKDELTCDPIIRNR